MEIKNNEILVKKPKSDLKNLFGSWSDIKDDDLRKIRSIWRGWNEKNLRGFYNLE